MGIINWIKNLFSGKEIKVEDNSAGKNASKQKIILKNSPNSTVITASQSDLSIGNKEKETSNPQEMELDSHDDLFVQKALSRMRNFTNIFGLKLLLFALQNLETHFPNLNCFDNGYKPTILKNYSIWLQSELNEKDFDDIAEYHLAFEELEAQDFLHPCLYEDMETEDNRTYFLFPDFVEYLKNNDGIAIIRDLITNTFKKLL